MERCEELCEAFPAAAQVLRWVFDEWGVDDAAHGEALVHVCARCVCCGDVLAWDEARVRAAAACKSLDVWAAPDAAEVLREHADYCSGMWAPEGMSVETRNTGPLGRRVTDRKCRRCRAEGIDHVVYSFSSQRAGADEAETEELQCSNCGAIVGRSH